ncbi:MAG: CocE/NonD family hydrolase [Candidatus Binatia bacterium]
MLLPFTLVRRFGAVALLVTLPLLAACGSDDDNNQPPATPTATRPAATATATNQPTATNTVAGPTATATMAPIFTNTVGGSTPTPTDVPPVTATPTDEVPPTAATATATATGTAPPSATVTATGIPTGTATATATYTPTGIPTGTATATATPTEAPPAFAAHGSVNQIWIVNAPAGAALELFDADETLVQSVNADAQGSFIFREVPAGVGYVVVAAGVGASEPVEVTVATDPPDQSFYSEQQIGAGYGYLKTRDGTLLSINVYLPGPIENGPYPTVIEYSGYDPANPDSKQPSTLITTVLGYAAVGINIRGTGCSGGAFQFFETLQSTDGYDAVEIIAAQPWVKNNKVGLVGLSYPAIAELFVSQFQPPSLVAIAPLSVVSSTGPGTLYPGGILNNGFATDWAADRKHDAQVGGQRWSQKRLDEGDQVCIDNMKLRDQTPDILQMIDDNEFYIAAVADPASPSTFVHNITVPTFLAGALQDEQTGGYFPTMLDQFTLPEGKVHFTIVNGNHTEPLIPAIFARWFEFLSLYVRREVPVTPPIAAGILAVLGNDIFGSPGLTLPPDRFTGMTYEEALAAFEADQKVRVLFDNGAGVKQPGASAALPPGSPGPGFEHSFDAWPVPGLVPTAWYFGPDGSLTEEPPTEADADAWLYSAAFSQNTTYTGGGDGIWRRLPPWHWLGVGTGTAVAYATAPLEEDTVIVGSASADLWIKSNAPDVDLQVTVSEIRPDGYETYVQTGWLRTSRRKLDEARSTELRPWHTHLEVDAAALPEDEFVEARVEIFPIAHAFRAGSRLRITIAAPGGDRPLWKFRALDYDEEVTVEIARSPAHPSRVVLPVVPGLAVPTDLPPCPSLRGQPCRTYVELQNG